jgi:hypothetical protein
MPYDGQPDPTSEDGDLTDAKPFHVESACVALVPVLPSVQWSQGSGQPLPRPDSIFVTHLIATAEQAPQTRTLRRATPADAQAAYRSVTDHNHITQTGLLTRQIS